MDGVLNHSGAWYKKMRFRWADLLVLCECRANCHFGVNILCCFKNIRIRVDVASRLGFGPQKLNSEFSTSWDNRHNIFETRLSLFGSEVTVAFAVPVFANHGKEPESGGVNPFSHQLLTNDICSTWLTPHYIGIEHGLFLLFLFLLA